MFQRANFVNFTGFTSRSISFLVGGVFGPYAVEYCRLQGFPDDWNEWGIDEQGKKVEISDRQRYKQMGNAVTTAVVAAIGQQL